MDKKTHHLGIFVSSLNIGGAEKVAITMANEFVGSGVRVDLIVMNAEGAMSSQVSPKVHIIDLGTKRGRSSFFSLLRYIKSSRPEAILSLLTVPNSLLGLTKIILQRKSPWLVGSERSYITDTNQRAGRKIVTYFLYAIASRIGYRMLDMNVALTSGISDRMKAQRLVKPSKIVVLPNPIDLTRISFDKDSSAPLNGRIQLLAVGRLDDLKDYPTMIRAVNIVHKTHKVSLAILGDGDKRRELQSLIDELNLSGIVTLHGFVADTSSWYRTADLLILSSKTEGFPNVIVEALAHGVPVVSTDCLTGPRDILTSSSYGSLVPVGDYSALAAAVLQACSQDFDIDVLRTRAEDFESRKICNLYLQLLVNNRGGQTNLALPPS